MWMGTIITMIGAAIALGLSVTVTVLWRRTHREMRQLRRDLRATQQELEIQRIVAARPDEPDRRRRHLRALAFLAPLLLWVREHHVPATAIGATAVGTVVAVAILAQAGAPSEPSRAPTAAPGEPFIATSSVAPSPTTTAPAPTTTALPTGVASRPGDDSRPVAATSATTTSAPAPPAPSPTSGIGPAPTTTSDQPPGEFPLLCVELSLKPLAELDLCIPTVD